MSVRRLVNLIRGELGTFRNAWKAEADEHGQGALVFMPKEISSETDGLECMYWTLDEIRSSLRDLQIEDEFAFRWIRGCEERSDLPVIIVAPDKQRGRYNLSFHNLSPSSSENCSGVVPH
jgi:hypothetical protein